MAIVDSLDSGSGRKDATTTPKKDLRGQSPPQTSIHLFFSSSGDNPASHPSLRRSYEANKCILITESNRRVTYITSIGSSPASNPPQYIPSEVPSQGDLCYSSRYSSDVSHMVHLPRTVYNGNTETPTSL